MTCPDSKRPTRVSLTPEPMFGPLMGKGIPAPPFLLSQTVRHGAASGPSVLFWALSPALSSEQVPSKRLLRS